MGIFIYETVSKSVTREEWEAVYEETLLLLEGFPLAERGAITYAGKEVICAVPSKERTDRKGRKGWSASMDYDSLRRAESYHLSRDLIGGSKVDPEAGDAIMGVLPAYLNYDWNDEKCRKVYSLWDAKSQGEPYHMYILAVACLIEDRLGEKAFVYGDITQGQCKKAVELANPYLKNPIRVPARCEKQRLYERISRLPLEDLEKVELFKALYLGVQEESFGNFMKEHFQASVLSEYWKDCFSRLSIGTAGFGKYLKTYLSYGFDLEPLCSMINRKDEEGNPRHEQFIKAVMECKLHRKDKHTGDYLDIEQESQQPYSIWTLFAKAVFGSAYNRKVNRYIPLEEIRGALKRGLGADCDVDQCIDQYLEEEAAAPEIDALNPDLSQQERHNMIQTDASEVFSQFMDSKKAELQNQREQYDISEPGDLVSYRRGNTLEPLLEDVLRELFPIYHGTTEEDDYKMLMQQTPEERCLFLIEQNDSLLLRDRDWTRIFAAIKEEPKAYQRYYPMVRLNLTRESIMHLVRALVLNDELYAYAGEMAQPIRD